MGHLDGLDIWYVMSLGLFVGLRLQFSHKSFLWVKYGALRVSILRKLLIGNPPTAAWLIFPHLYVFAYFFFVLFRTEEGGRKVVAEGGAGSQGDGIRKALRTRHRTRNWQGMPLV